ncbi:MAG: pantothenate kinase, partial [Flavobacteriales bacterium]
QTGKLPLVNPSEYDHQIGKSTEEALFSGAFYGLLHEIEGTITAFKQDYTSLNIILTGGDAKRFDKRLKNSIFADEFFLLKGLTHILKYND